MKNTTTVYNQNNRVSSLLWLTTTEAIKRVHPETGGNIHLAHNWGNEAAQNLLNQYRNRQHIIYTASQNLYKKAFKAEYPNHSANK